MRRLFVGLNAVFFANLIFVLSACTTPQMRVDPGLESNSPGYLVEGRQGWQVNQRLRFGDYYTGPVSRSWTRGYDIPIVVRFSGAKESLSFDLFDSTGQNAAVRCMGKLTEKDLLVLHKYFDINIQTKDAFTGSVIVEQSKQIDFFVSNLNQDNTFRKVGGAIRGEGMDIVIRPVTQLADGSTMLGNRVPGLEMVQSGQVVGAVELLNQGRIWLANDLPAAHKLVIGGVATALLLRSDLEDHND